MRVIFIINQDSNHQTVISRGGGASEWLFFLTAYKLSQIEGNEIIIYNKVQTEQILDGIQYKYYENNQMIKTIQNETVIMQRELLALKKIHEINPNNKYFCWCHDHYKSNYETEHNPVIINEYFGKHNIQVICISQFQKRVYKSKLPNVTIHIIYNALFKEFYPKSSDITYDKNVMLFASNWDKRLDIVLRGCRAYHNKNPKFRLYLLKPIYVAANGDDWKRRFPFIELKGCITDKNEYSKLIQGCLGVFGTHFPETFGCVFAEALHLGVPVIGDNSISTGYSEFVPDNLLCNFNNPNQIANKIEEIYNNRPNVKLGDQFYDDQVIQEWMKLLSE